MIIRMVLMCLLFTAGGVNVWGQAKTLHDFETKQLSDVFYSEGANFGDFNKDGVMDIVSGPYWYEGPSFEKKHEYYPAKPFNPMGYSDNFFAYSYDFNQDGWMDILIYGFPGKDASWYENPKGKGGHWKRHKVMGVVDNESPTFKDMNGDGQPDVLCSVGGYYGYATFDVSKPGEAWKFHAISNKSAGGRFTHGLGAGDVNGDGLMDVLERTGWWEQPKDWDGKSEWKKHNVPFAPSGSAQMFAGDVDGDGDNDVVTSLQAHGYGLAWYEQIQMDGKITFNKHVIMNSKPEDNKYGVKFSQLHAVAYVDMDGDGVKDIITGKRWWAHGPKGDAEPNAAAVVYWFKVQRNGKGAENVDFIPYQIHDDSGVGTQLIVGDFTGDKKPDIVVGNKRGTFVHIHKTKQVSDEAWEAAQPKPLKEQVRRPEKKHDGLEPEAAAKAMTVPDGFNLELIAGEPRLHQPVAMAIDARGRIWVAEAHTYPRRAKEGQGKDKIVIFEDKDGDGKFETQKLFMDGLNLVSGMEVGFGGVFVGAAPYLMFIPDRDGDDKPDGKPVILRDGFGYQDTHETLNSFIWGPDGWLYGCHGVFTHSKVGKPGVKDNEREPVNAAVWRYHPVKDKFETFAWGTSNPWGVDFNDHGHAFITACVIPHLYHIIQGGRYQRQGGRHFNAYVYDDIKTIADHAHYEGNIRDHAWWGRNAPVEHNSTDAAGGGHAHAGAMIYLGDNWPARYRNRIFMNNIHGNRVNQDILVPHRSGYIGKHGEDLLYANDHWYRGINLRYGPDGGVFLIDWYDPNACHRTNTEIWDRTNGRLYKLSYGKPKPVKVNLREESDEALVKYHLHENDWYVRMGRKVLQERAATGKKISAGARDALFKMMRTHAETPRRLRAMWTLHAIGQLGHQTLVELLGDSDEHVRSWAIQLMCEAGKGDKALIDLAHRETSAVTRLYLTSAMQRVDDEIAFGIAEGLVSHAEDADDANLPRMIWYGVEPLVMKDTGRALALASKSKIPMVSRFITRRAAVTPEGRQVVLEGIKGDAANESIKPVLEEIVAAVKNQADLKMPKQWPTVYEQLARNNDPEIRQHAQYLSIKFGDKRVFPALRNIVRDGKAPVEQRKEALKALVTGKDGELGGILLALLDDNALRGQALRGLAQYDMKQTPEAILSRYGKMSHAEKLDAVSTLATRKEYAHALMDALAKGVVKRSDISAFTVRQLLGFEDKTLAAKIDKSWGAIRSASADKVAQIAKYKKLLTGDRLKKADLPHGRQLYVQTCGACHQMFGAGGQIGPDITGSDRMNIDYLLENILDPNAVVGRDYQMTIITKKDNSVVTGMIREENDSAITLQMVNTTNVVAKSDIKTTQTIASSMMPEGQLTALKDSDVVDLIAYLQSPRQVPLPGALPVYDDKTRRVDGALEGEALKVLSKTGGNTQAQGMGNFKLGKWSGVNHLWWTGAKPGAKLNLELPVRRDGKYEVLAVMTKAPDYGIVQLYFDGKKVGEPIDLYDTGVVTTGVLSFGTHVLKGGEHTVTVEIVGANAKAVKAYMFGLDYVYLKTVE